MSDWKIPTISVASLNLPSIPVAQRYRIQLLLELLPGVLVLANFPVSIGELRKHRNLFPHLEHQLDEAFLVKRSGWPLQLDQGIIIERSQEALNDLFKTWGGQGEEADWSGCYVAVDIKELDEVYNSCDEDFFFQSIEGALHER
ncbi:hypothetical protein D3C80_1215230 [compost metagenome]